MTGTTPGPAETPPAAGPFPPAAPTVAVRPPLRRSRDDRIVAGVCGGVGRTLGVDPLLIRVLVVAFSVVGGAGLVAYLVGWLAIPEDGAATSEGQRLVDDVRRDPSSTRTVLTIIGAVVVAIVAVPLLVSPFLGGWNSGGWPVLWLVAGGVALVALLTLRRDPTPPVAPAPPFPPDPTLLDPNGAAMTTATTSPAEPAAGSPPGSTTAYPTTAYPTAAYPTTAYPTGYAYGGTGGYGPYGPAATPTPIPVNPPAPRRRSPLGLITLSAAILVTGVLAAIDVAGASIPGVVYLAAPLTVLGLGLLVGALAGHAKWLLWLAVPLALATAATAAVPAAVRDTAGAGVGSPVWRPTSVSAVAPEYQLAAGDATLDLRSVPLTTIETRPLVTSVQVGAGQLVVIVPRDARVTLDATVGIGELRIAGSPVRSGASLEETTVLTPVGTSSGTIDLTLEVGAGNLEVRRAAA